MCTVKIRHKTTPYVQSEIHPHCPQNFIVSSTVSEGLTRFEVILFLTSVQYGRVLN